MQDKILSEYWQEARRILKNRVERGKPEFPTGLECLDNLTGGFQRGEIWIVAGKSGSGKTNLALQLARSFADNGKHRVLMLSLEMKGWQLALRMYCEKNAENHTDIEQGLKALDIAKSEAFEKYLKDLPMEIVEYGYTFDEVLKIFGRFYKEEKPDVVFLDFMQLIEWKNFGDERIAIMEYIRKIKELANKHNIGFVIVSQLRRMPSGADYNRPPDMHDLMGSGSLEQMADKVLLIYKKTIETFPRYYINLAKNRQGEAKESEVKFIGWECRFEDINKKKEVKVEEKEESKEEFLAKDVFGAKEV